LAHPQNAEEGQGWEKTEVNDTLNIYDNSETRTPTLITQKVYDWHRQDTRMTELGDICVTAAAGWGGGGNNMPYVLESKEAEMETVVRRLTPMECERLQGYPDHWTDIGEWTDSRGKKHKDADSPRYKALGNSIALPFWEWMAGRMCALYDRPVLMASLFDGIGGFPLVYQRHGAIPVWASEIEEFPMAVTKIRFPEEGEDKE
jgi:DNA (cytosine-5)-methyltransferase 1